MDTVRVAGRLAAYDDVGAGPGPPLVCVHGFTGARDDFAAAATTLASGRRVIAVDLPGHGDSEPPEGDDDPGAYSLAALAAWLLAFVDRCGLDEVHLAGHSLGGLIVQRAAAQASHRLAGLVLASTGPGALPQEPAARVLRTAAALRHEGPHAALATMADPDPDPDPDAAPDERERQAARLAALPPMAAVGTARALATAEPMGAFLRGLDVPVLVLHGCQDDTWPVRTAVELASTIPTAELAVVDGVGHGVVRDAPHAWARAVDEFLTSADRGGARPARRRRDRSAGAPRRHFDEHGRVWSPHDISAGDR